MAAPPVSSSTLPGEISRKRRKMEDFPGTREDAPPPKKLRTSTTALLGTETAVTPRRRESSAAQSTELIDEHLQRQRVVLLMQGVKEKVLTAQATPSQLGEKLYRAVADEKLDEIRRLLDAGADVNYVNKYGSTALQRSLFAPREDLVELLLRRGADANAGNEVGITAMHLVAGNNPGGQCVDQLIRAGGDVNVRSGEGVTPLHTAADWNNVTTVRALLSSGARADLKPWDGPWANRTPVELTTSAEIRELLRSGL